MHLHLAHRPTTTTQTSSNDTNNARHNKDLFAECIQRLLVHVLLEQPLDGHLLAARLAAKHVACGGGERAGEATAGKKKKKERKKNLHKNKKQHKRTKASSADFLVQLDFGRLNFGGTPGFGAHRGDESLGEGGAEGSRTFAVTQAIEWG